MTGKVVSYDSGDVEQRRFLAALRAGEGGDNYWIGFGGTDLKSAPRDQWGFPKWSGKVTAEGPTHAAGAYQFQPGTWKGVAAKYNLNFANPFDQDQGAWFNAQERYARETGGRSLDADLDEGLYDKVRGALSREWTSLRDNPGRFLNIVSGGAGAELTPGPTDTSGTPSFFESPLQAASGYFVRGGLILVGIAVLLVALWALLNNGSIVPKSIPIIGK